VGLSAGPARPPAPARPARPARRVEQLRGCGPSSLLDWKLIRLDRGSCVVLSAAEHRPGGGAHRYGRTDGPPRNPIGD
jgi:hypothetical protein